MNVHLRTETPTDHKAVSKLIEEAFRAGEMEYANEHILVEKLRRSDAFIPDLSIVAELEDEIIGHILLTRIKIRNEEKSFDSLALAPVTVKPAFQKKGVGAKLIMEAHDRAKKLGHTSIILLGHEDYYPRFGYELTSKYGILLPFGAPEKNCMVIALTDGGLEDVSGTVEYPKAFFEFS